MYICIPCGKRYDLPAGFGTCMGPCGICSRLGDWSNESTRTTFTFWTSEIGYTKTKDALKADLLDWQRFNFRRKAHSFMARAGAL